MKMKEFGPQGGGMCPCAPLGPANALGRTITNETRYPYQFQNSVISLFMHIITWNEDFNVYNLHCIFNLYANIQYYIADFYVIHKFSSDRICIGIWQNKTYNTSENYTLYFITFYFFDMWIYIYFKSKIVSPQYFIFLNKKTGNEKIEEMDHGQ